MQSSVSFRRIWLPVWLVVVTFGLLSTAADVARSQDDRVSIASGVSGGTYRDVYARDLEAQLSNYTVIHRVSSGSGENLEILADRRSDFVFAQADVFAARLREEPDRFGMMKVLGRLGVECVFVAVRKSGAIHSLSEVAAGLEDRAAEVAVGPPQGGPSATWSNLVALSPELGEAVAHPVGDRVALRFLERGTFDVVVWVTDPTNFDHRMLRAVRDRADLELMPVTGDGFVAALPDGVQVYERGQVFLTRGGPATQTICTSAVLLARDDADPDLLERARRMRGLRRGGAE
jgi:uncharacterized protein